MSHQDRAFMTSFTVVLAILVVVAIVFYAIAHLVTGGEEASSTHARMEEKILENIAPVGRVNVAGSPSTGGAAAPAAATGPRSGKDIYAAACTACHSTGVAGAPKVSDQAAWTERAGKGMEMLVSNAVNGLNAMPPRGTCADCSDEEIRNAVAYMLEEAGVSAGGGQRSSAPAPAPAATPAAAASPDKGKQVYNTSCLACHSTGAAGAPKVGDKAAWSPRIGKGMDTLLTNAVNGINAMPPKGTCFACSEDDLRAAIEYMVAQSR